MNSSVNRRARAAAQFSFQPLESRWLLSATLLSQVPAQSVSSTGTTTVNLGTYFDDSSIPAGDTVVNIETNMPAPYNDIPIVLTNAATPLTVANFLKYISTGEYANTIIHRAIPGFVLQGGGYTNDDGAITVFGTIAGESATATLTNTVGTIAMALSDGPDTATSQWFINLANNDGTTEGNPNLDDTSDGGPFTAFGTVIYNGLNTLAAIESLPIVDDTANGAWNSLPVLTGTDGAIVSSVAKADLVTTNPVVVTDGVNFSAVSANTKVVTASIVNGVLTLTPETGGASGTTTVTVTATDLGGGTASSTFTVNVVAHDTTPPKAVAVYGKLVNDSSPLTYYKFSITFTDSVGVMLSSISGRPIYVTGPNYGLAPNTIYARPTSLSLDTNGTPIVGGYRIYPPTTDWTSANNGVYTIWLRKNRVEDVDGNFTPGEALATFTVDIPATKPAAVHQSSATPPVTAASALQPQITSNDESPDSLEDVSTLFA